MSKPERDQDAGSPSGQEFQARVQELEQERDARAAEVEHWVQRYNELDRWRAATARRNGELERELARVKDAGSPLPLQQPWLPIATAPKDGRVLLSLWGTDPQFISWIEGEGWRVLMPPARGMGFGVHGNFAPFQPAVWAPLPSRPAPLKESR